MSSSFRAVGLLVLTAGALLAQTAYVQNAAGNFPIPAAIYVYPFPVQVVQALSPTNVVAPGMVTTLSAPANEVSIRPSGSDTPIRAELISSILGQTTFVIPRNMPLGGAEIEYKAEGHATGWTNVNVVAASFQFFRIGPGGPATAQSVAANGSLSPVGLTTPAQPGQAILLTGSGLGNGTSFTVTVGGIPTTVVPATPHRAQPGPDEIMIQIPAGVPDGCYVPLVLTYNNTSVASTISKTSNNAPCVHPFQLAVADMKTLDSGGTLAVGEIDLGTTLQVTTPTAVSRLESASVNVTEMTAAAIASYFQSPIASGCQVIAPASISFAGSVLSGIFLVSPSAPDLGPALLLKNGPTTLTLNGPLSSYSATLPQPAQGSLTNPPPPVIAGGSWTWSSPGGADLAASSFSFTLPAPFQLNGSSVFSLSRSEDQILTWNGSAFDSAAILSASLPGNLTCTFPASLGTWTILARQLQQIPAGTLGGFSITVSEPGSALPHTQFKMQNGSTLLMVVKYSSGEAMPVDIP